jgi:hypothetical protein
MSDMASTKIQAKKTNLYAHSLAASKRRKCAERKVEHNLDIHKTACLHHFVL